MLTRRTLFTGLVALGLFPRCSRAQHARPHTIPLLPADVAPKPIAAWGVRRLRHKYTGPLCRVRRDNDNAEQDIFAAAYTLDTVRLLAFTGSNNGYVVKLYDQLGNSANDAVQATSGAQPRLVNAGTVETHSGLAGDGAVPACRFDGSDDILGCGNLTAVDGIAQLSIMVWGSVISLCDRFWIGKFTSGQHDGLYLNPETGCGGFFDVDDGANFAYYAGLSQLIAAGERRMVGMVFDGNESGNASRLKIYGNAIPTTLMQQDTGGTYSGTIPATTDTSTRPWELGSNSSLPRFGRGKLDAVVLSKSALSQSQMFLMAYGTTPR